MWQSEGQNKRFWIVGAPFIGAGTVPSVVWILNITKKKVEIVTQMQKISKWHETKTIAKILLGPICFAYGQKVNENN